MNSALESYYNNANKKWIFKCIGMKAGNKKVLDKKRDRYYQYYVPLIL